ncbi:hypothetical protein JCM1841_006817 [Sporobolomyces salmonicolor]
MLPIPSVLQHPPASSLPLPFPTASTSLPAPVYPAYKPKTEPEHRCSQCKRTKPASDFPIRLTNLQPYLVCLAHDWYWTEAKRALHWAPEEVWSVDQICDEARKLKEGADGTENRFMVLGGAEDRAALVQRIAEAGGWKVTSIAARASRAKVDPPPPPCYSYSLKPSHEDDRPHFKLTLYFHQAPGKYTMTLRPDEKGQKAAGPWSRPGRARKDSKTQAKENGGALSDLSAPPAKDKGKGRAGESSSAHFGSPSLDILVNAASAVEGDIHVDVAPPASPLSSAPNAVVFLPPPPLARKPPRPDPYILPAPKVVVLPAPQSTLSRAERDAQQMPPPPFPPRKKARRVEPSLVSPSISSSGSTFPNGSKPDSSASASASSAAFAAANQQAADNPYAHFLSFPSLIRAASFVPPEQPSSSSYPTPSKQPQPPPVQPLTLAELLASPYFDPPIIPLPPRLKLGASARGTSSSSLARAPPSPAPSATGKDLDDAVANALGARSTHEDYSRDDDEEEEEEEDYEDSIPDDSSDDEEREGGEEEDDDGDGGSVSSFFESSAEETEYGSSAEEGSGMEEAEEEDDEEEEDWLAGFVSKQMPGMSAVHSGGGAARRAASDGDELEGEEPFDEDEEIDELESSSGSGGE